MPWPTPSARPRFTAFFSAKSAPASQDASPPTVELDGVTFDMVTAAAPTTRASRTSSVDTLDSTSTSPSGSGPSRRTSASTQATSVASASTPARSFTPSQADGATPEPRARLAAPRLRRPSAPNTPTVPSAPLLLSAPFPGAERPAQAEASLLRRASAPARLQRPPQLPRPARGVQPASSEPGPGLAAGSFEARLPAANDPVAATPDAGPLAWHQLLRESGERAQSRRISRRRTDSPPATEGEMHAFAGAPPTVGGLAYVPARPSRLREVALPRDAALTRAPLSSPPAAAAWSSELPWLSPSVSGAPQQKACAARVLPRSQTWGLSPAQGVARRHFYREAGNVSAALAQLSQAPAEQLRAPWRTLAGDFVALNMLFAAAWPQLPPTGQGPLRELADKDAQHLVELWAQLAGAASQTPGLLRGTVRAVRHRLAPGEGELLSLEAAGAACVQLPPLGLVGRLRAAATALPALALALHAFDERHAQLAAGIA